MQQKGNKMYEIWCIAYCSCRHDVACDPCVHRRLEVDSLTSPMTRKQSSESRQYISHCRPVVVLAAPTAAQHNDVMYADERRSNATANTRHHRLPVIQFCKC